MNVKQTTRSKNRQEDKRNMYILKLERCNQDVLQLRKQLCSYICEPQTYKSFEQIEILRNNLEAMKDSNRNIIDILKKGATQLQEYALKAEANFTAFQTLSAAIENYVNRARNC